MEDGYHVNVARNTSSHAWNSKPGKPVYRGEHYCHIVLGRIPEEAALRIARDLQQRFPEGDEPGQFRLSLSHWQSTGQQIPLS